MPSNSSYLNGRVLFENKISENSVGTNRRFLDKGSLRLADVENKEIDDQVQNVLNQGFRQILLPVAGLDTRPYRTEGTEKAKVFEVDLPWV